MRRLKRLWILPAVALLLSGCSAREVTASALDTVQYNPFTDSQESTTGKDNFLVYEISVDAGEMKEFVFGIDEFKSGNWNTLEQTTVSVGHQKAKVIVSLDEEQVNLMVSAAETDSEPALLEVASLPLPEKTNYGIIGYYDAKMKMDETTDLVMAGPSDQYDHIETSTGDTRKDFALENMILITLEIH